MTNTTTIEFRNASKETRKAVCQAVKASLKKAGFRCGVRQGTGSVKHRLYVSFLNRDDATHEGVMSMSRHLHATFHGLSFMGNDYFEADTVAAITRAAAAKGNHLHIV